MKQAILLVLFFIFSSNPILFSQNIFESGYFIKNTGEKVTCLIKNNGWRSNPTSFKWKSEFQGEENTETIEQVSEFSIPEIFVYKRFEVAVNLATNEINDLEYTRAIEKQKKTAFLKVLVSSPTVSLYEYQQNNIINYFYTTSESSLPVLLEYKRYKIRDEEELDYTMENTNYRFQLERDMPVPSINTNTVAYKKKDLERYFQKFLETKWNVKYVYS